MINDNKKPVMALINLFFIVGTILLLISFFIAPGYSKSTTSITGYSCLLTSTLLSILFIFIVQDYSSSKFRFITLAIIVQEVFLLVYALAIEIVYSDNLKSGNYDPYYDVLNQCFLFLVIVLYGVTSYAFMFYKPHKVHDTDSFTQPIININTYSMLSIVGTLGIITLVTMHLNMMNFHADG
jgi:hypothetical protein